MLGGRPAPRGVLSPGLPVFLAARAKNSPPGGIPGSFLPCAPLTWDRGASSRVSSGRNPRLAGGRGRAAGEGRDGRTDRRTDTASALAPWHDGEHPAAAVPAAVAVGAGLCPGARPRRQECLQGGQVGATASPGPLGGSRVGSSVRPSMDGELQPGAAWAQGAGRCWGAPGPQIPSPWGYFSHTKRAWGQRRGFGSVGNTSNAHQARNVMGANLKWRLEATSLPLCCYVAPPVDLSINAMSWCLFLGSPAQF